MVGRSGWSSPSATRGRAQSGWRGSNGSSTTGSVSGNATATTTPPIHGRRNATGSVEAARRGNGRHDPAGGDRRTATRHQGSQARDKPLSKSGPRRDPFACWLPDVPDLVAMAALQIHRARGVPQSSVVLVDSDSDLWLGRDLGAAR